MPKIAKGGPFWALKIHFVAKYQKNEGGPMI